MICCYHYQMNNSTIPVTVLCGFLGAGKTTLLRHLLASPRTGRAAVLVNDMAELNVDARLLEGAIVSADEELVELSNGCICCTLREDLLREVARLASLGRFDRILVESTGVAEPLPIAETFAYQDEEGAKLSDIARLDAIVTVVDAGDFLERIDDAEALGDLGMATGEDDDRNLADLLVEQVEGSDILVLNKCDSADPERLDRIESVLARLRPGVRILRATRSQVDPDLLLDTGAHDVARDERTSGWLSEGLASSGSESDEYGISSFVYRARRPFHPARLMAFLEDGGFDDILRAKGWAWIASRGEEAAHLQQAGGSISIDPAGPWLSAFPAHELAPEEREELERLSEGPWGDRRQELVLIGQDLDVDGFRQRLDACLLDEREMAAGPKAWSRLPDPLPAWEEEEA